MVKRTVWLSITPEPEAELPAVVATLRSGAAASEPQVAAEAGRIARLITRSGQRSWLRYLHGVLTLVESRAGSPDPAVRRAVVAGRRGALQPSQPAAGAAGRRGAADRRRPSAARSPVDVRLTQNRRPKGLTV